VTIQRQLPFEQEFVKLRQVAKIVSQRVRRHVALIAQVASILLD